MGGHGSLARGSLGVFYRKWRTALGEEGNASGRFRLLLSGASVQNKSYSPFQVRPLECNHLTPGERGRSWQNGAGGERILGAVGGYARFQDGAGVWLLRV